ncbi:MAG: hypothetical protein GY820_38370 [Gammaproteobacteria bacterium]|nr:hypothetical protein [Gammaproteobacteria bacterium]
MSFFDTRQALLTKLITSAIVVEDNIAYENKSFNPSGKSLWLSCNFIPATNDMMGKSSASRNEQRGIFQISVFVKKNSENFDNDQLSMVDSLLTEFFYGSQASSSSQIVDILDTTVTEGRESESWFQRDLSVNYLTFSTR